MRIARSLHLGAPLATLSLVALVAGQSAGGVQQPARDTPGQKQTAAQRTALIAGRVVAADTGKPVVRARVFAAATELPQGRAVLTDSSGGFQLAALPAGRYTLTVAMSGFISLSWGQRRPLQPGTPLQLGEGQQIKGIEFRLPRGSVIGGRVFDDSGDAVIGATVRVLRYHLQQGERRPMPTGIAQTDDRGVFRIWGLNPGNYYVDAQWRVVGTKSPSAPSESPAPGRGEASPADDRRAFAPTYYPGGTSPAQARPVTIGVGEERLDIDFSLELVSVARVSGTVVQPSGAVASKGSVSLVLDTGVGGIAGTYSAALRPDGTFQILNVPPGTYNLQAISQDGPTSAFGRERVSINGDDVTGLQVTLGRGAVVAGRIDFKGSARPPEFRQVRISAIPAESSLTGAPIANTDSDGDFLMLGVQPGYRLFRPASEIPGWTLQSIVVDGRDITDTPIALVPNRSLDDVLITFTDSATAISGTLKTDRGAAVSDYTMLAFSTDESRWTPQSRFIVTARPDQNGTFVIRRLPPGEYFLTAIDPVEPGEWFDPLYLQARRLGATRVSVREGESRTQDFLITTR